MSESAWDAIVVGAGYGGVTAAAVLAAAGRRVLILERNGRPGGKAMVIRSRESTHEMWPIGGGPAQKSRFHELVRLIGGAPGEAILTPERACEFIWVDGAKNRRSYFVPARPENDPFAVAAMLEGIGVQAGELGGLFAMTLATRLLTDRELDALDDVSMKEWLDRFELPVAMRAHLFSLMNLLFVVGVDRLPASEAIRTLRTFHAGGAGRYHRGGFGKIAEDAVAFVRSRGGEFLGHVDVERIVVRDGCVAGVETARGSFSSPLVLSNAGIQPTALRLLRDAQLPGEWLDRVRALEPSWAFVGTTYHLSRPIFDAGMTVAFGESSWLDTERFAALEAGRWPELPLVFVMAPAAYDPTLVHGRTKQVALAGTIASPDPDSSMSDRAIAELERAVEALWPALPGAVIRKQRHGARHVSRATRDAVVRGQGGECIGLGQIIGQCGRSKPDARGPIPGLWFVGCDAGGWGCGTHQAVDSGFRVAERLLRERWSSA